MRYSRRTDTEDYDALQPMLVIAAAHRARILLAPQVRGPLQRMSSPSQPPAPPAPARPPSRRPLPGANPASARPRRPHRRIRASRLKAQVRTGCRVLEPHSVSLTRSGPEPPGYGRGMRTRRVRVALRWRGSRPRTDTSHCPISAHTPQRRIEYMRRRFPCLLIWPLSCGNLRFRAGWNSSRPSRLSSIPSAAELREVCYRVNGPVRLPEMTNGLQRAHDMTLR